jgi:hypothetical protein
VGIISTGRAQSIVKLGHLSTVHRS